MKEVLQNLLLAILLLSVFFSGCNPTSPAVKTNQHLAVAESTMAEERIFFPNYNLSVSKPPQEWEMLEEAGEGELAIWLNREAGSVIEIMVSRAVKNLSYHNIAAEFNRITCDLVQQRSPTVTCAILEEKQVNFNSNEFYCVRIVYQGLTYDSSVKSLIYLHRTDNFVYHFLFMEEKQTALAHEMMRSVVFHESKGKNDFSEQTTDPLSLVDACYCGDMEKIERILGSGVDINARDKDGVTALAYASDRGHTEIVKKLLANGAEVNLKSNIGCTALMNAAYMGHVGIVNILIANGADVNAQSYNGTTALMNAAARGHMEIVEVLLAHNADMNTHDDCGLNALWNAISSGYCDIVKILISYGAKVNTRSIDGTSALMNAAFTGNVDMVKMLLEAGAEVNAKAENGWTALILAKRNGHAEIVRLLIEAGAMDDSHIEFGTDFNG